MRGKKAYYVIIAAFLAYSGWMIAPYVQSVIVRDAAVTSWLRAAVSPIAGRVTTDLPEAGSTIGPDGHVVTIRNSLLLQERRAVENSHDRALEAESNIAEAREYLNDLEKIDRERVTTREANARVFRDQLKTEIANLQASIKVGQERIKAIGRIARRQEALTRRGTGSAAALDEALLRAAEIQAHQAALEAKLNFALLRDRVAAKGTYITADGETPQWVRYGELEITLQKRQALHDLHHAERTLAEARKDMKTEEGVLADLTETKVVAPPGSLVTSVLAQPEDTLTAGDHVVQWIDCKILLVDVPVSDAELPLITRGMAAEVILEGEAKARNATVHLTRGSSATLGQNDLAAIAKGRAKGVAQVILTLDATPDEFNRCPVGRAAYVEFPGIGLIDILRARLRL